MEYLSCDQNNLHRYYSFKVSKVLINFGKDSSLISFAMHTNAQLLPFEERLINTFVTNVCLLQDKCQMYVEG